MLRLATGQQMVQLLKSRGVSVKVLTKKQLRDGNGGADVSRLNAGELDAVLTRTPLWFYVLREAEINRGRLTGVGARLVAETFHRWIEASRFSTIRDPGFRPQLGPDPSTFRMSDLLFFAFEGKPELLAPLGD